MENILGTKLGDRYLIEELVGVGGMCNVYRAFDAASSTGMSSRRISW